MADYTLPPRAALSDDGRRTLAAAVTVDHNWNLPHNGVEKLIVALDDLSDEDLQVAGLLATCLTEAVACVHIQRDAAKAAAERGAA